MKNDNKPIPLEKYLGALGHSIVLKEGTLEYIHAHAGEQNDMIQHEGHTMETTLTNSIQFTTTLPEAGKYKIFT